MINWQPGITLEQVEKQVILEALRFYRGVKTQTAISLGIAIRTLDNKLEKYEDEARKESKRFDDEREKQTGIIDRLRGVELTRAYQVGANNPNQPPAHVYEAKAGIRVEPAEVSSAKHAMSMSKQSQVQEVLQGQTSGHSKHKRG